MIEGRGAAASLEAVTHRYGKTIALDDVTLAIPANCMVGLIGPDGVGKSSVLSLVAGARKIQTGTVHVFGGDMASRAYRSDLCPRIAFMPQGLGRNLYPDLSIRENIEFFSRLFEQSRSEREWRIAELLRATGLAPFAGRPAKKLSGGMRRKLGFSMAMLHDPPLLVLDEPSTGIDQVSRVDLWRLVSEAAAAGAAVVMSTTYLDEAERAASLLALEDGRTLASGTLQDVLDSFAGAITRTTTPHRRAWAWRRGREYHEYWPTTVDAPIDSVAVTPDLEDVVITMSMLKRHDSELAP